MKTELVFKLTKPARKKGGDRYEAEIEVEDRPMVIYVPQSISREVTLARTLKVTIETQ